MAKIPQGILGGIVGKIGGIIGSSWKGINVIKTKPLSVANPRTAAQVAQRLLFSNTVAYAVIILATVIKPLWDRFASRQSGFNAFIQANVALFNVEKPRFDSGLVISKGKMAASPVSIGVNDVRALLISWEGIPAGNAGFMLETDVPFAVISTSLSGTLMGIQMPVTRVAGEFEVTVPNDFITGEKIDVFLAFRRADGTIVSNTSSDETTVA